MHGHFETRDNVAPAFKLKDALDQPQRAMERIILPPSTYAQEQEKITERWPAAVNYITENGLNEFHDGDISDVGIVVQGGLYNTLMRALAQLDLADYFGASRIPIYVLNVTYPLVPGRVFPFRSR